jgi:hypothetical protein
VSFLGRRYFKLPILSCPRIPPATQAIAIDAFLRNKKTEGKQSKNIYFPIRFTAWTSLKNTF